MRRSLLTFVAVALFGSLLTASNASACCHKKAKCVEPVAYCAPVECAPAPVCAPRKKCGGLKLGGLFNRHKKAVCTPAPVCETVVVVASPQASGQN